MVSRQQQVNEVVDGLGLGMASVGETRVTSSRTDLELALSDAWSHWAHTSAYPSIERAQKPEHELWEGIVRSNQRTNVAVAWKEDGGHYDVRVALYDATPEEAARFVSDRPLSDWKSLASFFLDRLGAGAV